MRKRSTVVLVVLMGAALAALVFWPRFLVLEVARADFPAPLLCAKMGAGEEVVLAFVHSVNRRPVYDTIRVASDRLVVVKSVFDSFGAGMPEASTEEGTLRVTENGWLEWTINRPMPEVVVRIGWVANHTLRLKGRQVALADLASPGTAVALRPRTYSWFDLWKGRCIR
ncbi:MAG: hypothetical protein A2Z31_01705 [candidate division NC10 bacterium RBG_16_65_8]|nr:MAG: hypothetical protein A2Z31_01705 [candidate division NC10 bacterium RBG_16_65_8]